MYLPKAMGTFNVIASTPETVTIEEDGLTNVISVDRITLAPQGLIDERKDGAHIQRAVKPIMVNNKVATHGDNPIDDEPIATPAGMIAHQGADTRATNEATEHASYDDEVFMDGIATHDDSPGKSLYQVRWYGYAPHDDTLEPPGNIPDYFVRRYERNLPATERYKQNIPSKDVRAQPT